MKRETVPLSSFGRNLFLSSRFFGEHEETLKWYKQHYEANPARLDEVPERDRAYFELVKDMYVEPPRVSKPRRRMRTASENSDLNQLALTPRRLQGGGGGGGGKSSGGGGEDKGAVEAEAIEETTSCPISFSLGGKPAFGDQDGEDGFGIEICDVISAEGKKYQGSVSSPQIDVGFFRFAATGEIAYVVDNYEEPDNSPCCFEGKIEISVGVGVDLFALSFWATMKGSLAFAQNSDGNAKLQAGLGVEIALKIFGLVNIGASVSGAVVLTVDNFGMDTATIAWSFGVAIQIDVLFFKISIPWTGEIVPQQKFVNRGSYAGDWNPHMVAGDWTKDCACGDFLKCGTIESCENWPTDTGGLCNEGNFEYIHYAWDEEARCSPGYKRCYCKKRKLTLPPRGFEWTPCYMHNSKNCPGDRNDCMRDYCTKAGLRLPPDGEFESKPCHGYKMSEEAIEAKFDGSLSVDEAVAIMDKGTRYTGKCIGERPIPPPPPPGPPGPQGFRGAPGPPGPGGVRGLPCKNFPLNGMKDVSNGVKVQEGQVKDAFDQVAWMTTNFEDTVIGSIPDAQREPREAMQYAKHVDQGITELSDKYIRLANEISTTFADQLSELKSDLLFNQPIASLRLSKATSVPCGPCTWPERTFQIISASGPAFEFQGPRQNVAMGTPSPSVAAQQWTFTASKTLKSSDDSCVDFSDEYAPGGVGVWDCHRGANQLIVYSSLTKQLKTVWGNQCLDFNAEHQSLGSWFCYAGLNQEWTLSELEPGNTPSNCPESCTWPEQQLHVISHRDGLAMQAVLGKDIDLGVPNAAFGEQLFTWNPDSLQLQTGQGQGKKCVAMTGQSDGAKLRLADCNPSVDDAAFQVFTYIEADKMIKHFYLNLCLDNGGQGALHLWTCSSTNVNQKFELV
eukprot:TRINITY_DN2458_c0_g1_i6.p1 TRINITY_DN2458_c0_g1~~TRINITY_DN2458_c0_g1_i6.p1  ORF type:complete len:901 (+),score=78.53 TRINITY_DN2458_c0_g1_i6:1364-4066(+)